MLFYIPVTSELLQQRVIALSLICRASERSIVSFLKEIFDYSISLGGVHSILEKAIAAAQKINQAEILSNINIGAHDEIFQGGTPILVGSCIESTYSYLLNQTDFRDACTWGVYLLDLEKKGLQPDYTIADGARGIRSGQSQVWPTIPCLADVFHALRDGYKVATYLENKAFKALDEFHKLKKKRLYSEFFSRVRG